MRIETVPAEKIRLGNRHRTDLGDLDSLAASIADVGLLQPIGVDEYYTLIFGARRLIACKEFLNWAEIPCTILKLDSILAGEYAENEFRKQFTASERAAIGKAIEEELGDRRGQRTDLRPIDRKLDQGESREIAARRSGFESPKTFERAKHVTERGAPEVIKAMDVGDVSISAAATIASQPKPDQARIIALPKDERREVINQIRKAKADRESDERRARDLRLFRGLHEAVALIANFYEDPRETWAGLSRVSAFSFSENLDRAIHYLTRLRKEHPNEISSQQSQQSRIAP